MWESLQIEWLERRKVVLHCQNAYSLLVTKQVEENIPDFFGTVSINILQQTCNIFYGNINVYIRMVKNGESMDFRILKKIGSFKM